MIHSSQTAPFPEGEYLARLDRVRDRMARSGVDLLLCTHPCDIDYLSGHGGSQFSAPQYLLVHQTENEPVWVGPNFTHRDPLSAPVLGEGNIERYPPLSFARSAERHPLEFVAEVIRQRRWAACRIAIDTESAEFLIRVVQILQRALPNAVVQPYADFVRHIRAVKSSAEIAAMQQAARILNQAMGVAMNVIQPGVRQCDAAAEILATSIAQANRERGSELVNIAFLPRTKGISAIQQTWTPNRFLPGEAVMVRITARCHGYHVPIGRTKYLGKQPSLALLDARRNTLDAMTAALSAIRPGVCLGDIESAWRRADGDSRSDMTFGYWIGLDSPRLGEARPRSLVREHIGIEPGMTFSMMPDIWSAELGVEFSDPVYVTQTGVGLFTTVQRNPILS